MKINRSLLTNFNPDNDVTFYQNVTAESLSGTGTRMVVANSAGLLSTQALPTSGITGSGTANYIPKFATSTSLGNSVIYETSSNILINSTSDTGERLQVTGSAKITSNLVVDTDTLYVDATKNAVGIGKAPITCYSDDRTIQLGFASMIASSSSVEADLRISNNSYFSTSITDKYIANGYAAIYRQSFNSHIFQAADTGTAGNNITWVDQMQILNDGTTLIATNTTSGNYKLQVNGNTYTNGEIKTAAPTGGTARNWRLGDALSDSGATADTKIEIEINGTTYYLMAYSSAL